MVLFNFHYLYLVGKLETMTVYALMHIFKNFFSIRDSITNPFYPNCNASLFPAVSWKWRRKGLSWIKVGTIRHHETVEIIIVAACRIVSCSLQQRFIEIIYVFKIELDLIKPMWTHSSFVLSFVLNEEGSWVSCPYLCSWRREI